MRYLIMVRHGSYNAATGELTSQGEQEIRKVAQSIKDLVEGDKMEILTSPVLRAAASARIIADPFKARCLSYACLAPLHMDAPNLEPQELVDILGLCRKYQETETLVLVTHWPEIESFVPYFGHTMLQLDLRPQIQKLYSPEKGEGIAVDCEQKMVTKLPKGNES